MRNIIEKLKPFSGLIREGIAKWIVSVSVLEQTENYIYFKGNCTFGDKSLFEFGGTVVKLQNSVIYSLKMFGGGNIIFSIYHNGKIISLEELIYLGVSESIFSVYGNITEFLFTKGFDIFKCRDLSNTLYEIHRRGSVSFNNLR